jgi:hypothetical protein
MAGEGRLSEFSACNATAYGSTGGAGVVGGAAPLEIQRFVVVVPPALLVHRMEYQLPGPVTPGGGPTALFNVRTVVVQIGTKPGGPLAAAVDVSPVGALTVPGEEAEVEAPTEIVLPDSDEVVSPAYAAEEVSAFTTINPNPRMAARFTKRRICPPQRSALRVSIQ